MFLDEILTAKAKEVVERKTAAPEADMARGMVAGGPAGRPCRHFHPQGVDAK